MLMGGRGYWMGEIRISDVWMGRPLVEGIGGVL